jgi:hypothetical protein
VTLLVLAATQLALCLGCGPREVIPKYTEPLVVMREGTKLLLAPADFAGVVDHASLGTELKAVPEEADVSYDLAYAEVELADGQQGFIERKYLGPPAEWQQVLDLRASAAGIQPQADGTLESRANLRIAPGRDTRILDSIAGKAEFQMYRRVAIMNGDDKEIWYLVDVGEGRIGFMFTRQLDYDVPRAFPPYTKYRRTVAWQTLGGDPEHPTYIAASIGDGDRGCDFDKVEIYAWDGPGAYYATVFVESGLEGLLPITTEEVDGKWFFELRELKDEGIEVKRWSDTRPGRVVETRVEASDGILH